jgi:hypothetical protein
MSAVHVLTGLRVERVSNDTERFLLGALPVRGQNGRARADEILIRAPLTVKAFVQGANPAT